MNIGEGLMLMEKKELENWEKTRKQGAKKYVLKTTLTAYFVCFFVFIIANGYVNRDELDKYIEHNIANIDYVLLTSAISIVFMAIATYIVWLMSEKRYQNTLKQNKKEEA